MKRLASIILAVALLLSGFAPSSHAFDKGPTIATIPWTSESEAKTSLFGVAIDPPGAIGKPLETVTTRVADVRGVGISGLNDARIRGSVSKHCYVGIELTSSDGRVTDSDSFNNRDVCLRIARDAGNCQSTSGHYYGARIAVYNQGGWQFRSDHDTIADSYLGTLCDAKSKFTGTMFQHNMVCDAVLRGGSCELNFCTINLQLEAAGFETFNVPGLPSFSGKTGARFDGGGGRVRGCSFVFTNTCEQGGKPTGRGAKGLTINASDFRMTDTDLIDADGLGDTTGIEITGERSGIYINCDVHGFEQPGERVLVAKEKCEINALIRTHGHVPKVDLADGCTGTIIFELGK